MKTIYGFQQKSQWIKHDALGIVLPMLKVSNTLCNVFALDDKGKTFGIETKLESGKRSRVSIMPFIINWDWDSLNPNIIDEPQIINGTVTNLPNDMVIAEGVKPVFQVLLMSNAPAAQKLQTVPGVTQEIAQAVIKKFPNISI